jgi:glutaredoxin-related protein
MAKIIFYVNSRKFFDETDEKIFSKTVQGCYHPNRDLIAVNMPNIYYNVKLDFGNMVSFANSQNKFIDKTIKTVTEVLTHEILHEQIREELKGFCEKLAYPQMYQEKAVNGIMDVPVPEIYYANYLEKDIRYRVNRDYKKTLHFYSHVLLVYLVMCTALVLLPEVLLSTKIICLISSLLIALVWRKK